MHYVYKFSKKKKKKKKKKKSLFHLAFECKEGDNHDNTKISICNMCVKYVKNMAKFQILLTSFAEHFSKVRLGLGLGLG